MLILRVQTRLVRLAIFSHADLSSCRHCLLGSNISIERPLFRQVVIMRSMPVNGKFVLRHIIHAVTAKTAYEAKLQLSAVI